MARVVLYTTDACSFCEAAKKLLESEQVPYELVYLDRSAESRRRVQEETGGSSFPQIVIDGQPIGGFQELLARREQLAELAEG